MIIATDFDGTLCESAWPYIGEPNTQVIEWLKGQKRSGAKIILWTCRHSERLREALAWCEEMGITIDAVNENLPEIVRKFGFDTRKVFADVYLDDKTIPLSQLTAMPVAPPLHAGVKATFMGKRKQIK